MPYRLRVTEEEVRQELAKMGYTGLSDDAVSAMRKDLLKLIKSDLRKLKQERRGEKYADSSNLLSSSEPEQTRHTRSNFLSVSHTSEEKDESTGESGYSESESTSCLSERASISLGDVIPQKQVSAEIQTKRIKEALPKDTLRKKSEDASSRIHREPKMISKKKSAPVEKKALPEYPSRPDPVRLYHYYKAHWDQYKVPGEDPRLKLRWAVRSKLFYAE